MSLMDDIKEEYGITREEILSSSITPPPDRIHTSPYLHQVEQGQLSVINHSDYNELSKHDFLTRQTVMSTFIFDVKYLVKFVDEGLYGYTESTITSEELIRQVVMHYPYTRYPDTLPPTPMLQSCYISIMAELARKFVIVGIYNTIPEHQLTDNGYLIVRVPAILTHCIPQGDNQRE